MTTILVVDDEPDFEPLMLKWFRRQIQQETYSFRFVSNGREALAVLRGEPRIDLILLDINMPELDGLTLLNELPAIDPLLRAVMVSAYGDMENIRTAMNRGAFDFVCKPIDFTDLEVTIEKTVEHVRQLQESRQLRIIDELKTRFFDNITHEFRTPLTLIMSPVSQLLQRYPEPVDLHQGLRLVEHNAHQLLQLINQLLDLAKLESGHLAVVPETGDLGDFIGQIVGAFQPLAKEKNLTLIYQNNSTAFVAFDADKLEQIVRNLIINAIKFTESGSVTVVLSNNPNVNLTVTDTGIGISPEKLPFIFNRFYQIQPSGSTRSSVQFSNPGTGIGLALVKELTELMGGTVKVTSHQKSLNRPSGTTFHIDLPLIQVDERTEGPRVKPSISVLANSALPRLPDNGLMIHDNQTEKPLVLVVEDNIDLCAFIAGELSDSYRVLTATDGLDGWQVAQVELPDLVLTDGCNYQSGPDIK